jgi:hypothetical protein
MNTFTIEKLPDEPIIVFSILDGWQWKRDFPEATPNVLEILDAQTAPVFWITDLSKASMNLDEAIWGA